MQMRDMASTPGEWLKGTGPQSDVVISSRIRLARNLVQFPFLSQATDEQKQKVVDLVHDKLTTSGSERKGLINVASAPREVLMAIPGMDESAADALIAYRLSFGPDTTSASGTATEEADGPLASIAWITQVLERDQAVAIGDYITTQHYQRSVDIVAVSGDGRAFERYRLVYDTSGDQPRKLYWQRLTHLGWPLDPQILESLKKGTPISDLIQTTDRGSF